MSIFKVKDLDVKLGEILKDKDLKNLNRVSKYYLRILDEAFYKKRFEKMLSELANNSVLPKMNLYDESWKKFYYYSKYALEVNQHSLKIEKAITEDRADILSLIFRKYGHRDNSIYDWEDRISNWIDPIQLSISRDSLECFSYLLQFTVGYYPTSVSKKHAHKIMSSNKFRELLNEKERIDAIIYSFENGCEICFSTLYSSDLQDAIIEELYNVDITSFLDLSEAFSNFMNTISLDDILKYKEIAIHRDKFPLIKLFTIFSSIFR